MGIAALPAFADSVTTRIETRQVYGATVTEEHGVRVIRPLPPHDRVIINPNNAPIYLGFNETYSYSYGPSYVPDMSAYSQPGYAGAWAGGHFNPHRKGHGQRGPKSHSSTR
jgi:hypothetical protein